MSRLGVPGVTALGTLLRLLPLLSAIMLLAVQPLGIRAPVPHDTIVASHEHDVLPPRQGDLVTRKQRHAASLEEFFAIDDDSDQYAKAPPGLAAMLARSWPVAERPRPPLCYREALPTHRPCAAPQTGPPHA